MSLLLSLHLIAAITWIGGIFLVNLFLAPTLKRQLADPAARLAVICALFGAFFAWVWLAGAVLLASGCWMVLRLGGVTAVGPAVWVMVAGGSFMVLLALYVFFFPFLALRRAVQRGDWPHAAAAAGKIRWLSSVNLVLAVPVVVAGVVAFHG